MTAGGSTEHFATYTSAKRDYLVTITGAVQNLASDAVYGWGFVTDSAAPERFYVKLDPKPVAVPYKRTVSPWKERSDAYLESYECARAFRKAAEKK